MAQIRHFARGKRRLKTLHKYLTGQVLATLSLTVAVFAFVVLLLNLLQVLPLLFRSHANLWLVLKAVGLLLPFACVYALPMGFITATLLVFGRFSAEQELTAARASGISLLSLVLPVLLLSLFCCGVSAWFNMEIGPRSRVAFLQLKDDMVADLASAQLPEGRFIRDFPGYIFFVEKNDGGKLENVMIYRLQNETNLDGTIFAARGQINANRTNNQFIVELYDCRFIWFGHQNSSGTFASYPLDLSTNLTSKRSAGVKISDMTFRQLRQELRDLENLKLTAMPAATGTNAAAQLKAQLAALRKQQKDFIEPVRVAMHREIAFSFACFGFTLVGIPLGIRVHRRETNIGIAIALALVVVYYAFVMLGASLSARPEFYPHLILWLPNFIFQAVGAVLLWRANKGI
jgi:lipopolysaccharide export system permease protein